MKSGRMGEEYEVVISGVGGKFPEADQIDELKEKLMNKCNLVTVDDRRWQQGVNGTPPALGKARDVEKFDSAFFGIHHRLSNFMDPQNRHILERSFEAIIDSGYNPNSLKGGNIGVYIATSLNETEYFLITQKIHDGFGILGLSRAMLPNRISYFFNFKGPSQTVHSGWECGIEVLTLAAKQIRDGQIEAALIGVPNLHMFSQVAMNSATMGFLTFEKNAKPFDVNANGYIQSEAVVILFLQRKQDARRIYATVVHSNTCPFGLRNAPFTHCPEQPIVSFLKEFYLECQVDPKSVNFVEADGCAIKENDLTELKALSQVIGKDETSSLLVGSVKGNVGHTEAAASLVGVVKAIIALDSGIIPSTIMFKVPHLQMPEKIKIVSENVPLVGDLVAVNSLSFTGGLGHALLKQNPKEKFTSSNSNNIIPRLLLVSARNAAGAEKIIQKVSNMPLDYEFVSLVNDVHLSEIPGHLYRTYVVHSGNVGKTISEFAETKSKKSQVWFVFSGMGSQWPGMGRGLLNLKVFADSIAKCDKVLAPRGIDIYKILTDDNPNAFDNILNCFVGIACMQVALVDLLYSIGIKPDGIIGHSVGEFGCAYADGCFTAEQMVLASYARGQASLDTKLIHGTMAAVGIGYRNIKDRLPPGIEVACHNSSESCTISGPTNDVKTFVDKLSQEGIFARLVNSGNIAYHSQYISPAGPKLLSYMKKVVPESKPRSPRWISSSVPYNEWNKPMAQYSSPEYHTNNLLSPVLFEEACKHIPIDAICIEIAPHGLLQAIIRRSLKNCIHIPLTLRNSTCSITYLLSAIGKLYLNNLHPDVNAIFPKVEYPVSRETPSLASLVTWDHSENWTYGEKYRTIYTPSEEKIELNLNHKKFKEINGYKINDDIMVPAFALLFYVWEKLIKIEGKVFLETAVVFEDVWVHEMLTVSQFRTVTLLVTVQHISGKFEVTFLDQAYKAKTLLSGYCSVVPSKAANIHNESLPNDGQLDSTYLYIQSSDFYDIFKAHGYSLDGGFQNVEGLYVGDKDIIGKINWTGSWVAFFEGLAQIIIHLKLQESSEGNAYVPLSIQKLQINPTEFFSLNKKEISVCMNTILNTVYCDGVKLTGYTLKPLNLKSSLRWSIQSPVFIPYGSTKFKSVDEFLTACIQVTSTNKFGIFSWRPYHKSKVIILENNQQTFKFRNELQNKVETVTVSTWDQLAEYPNTFLVTTIYNIVNEIKDKKCLTTYQFYLIQSPVCFSQEFQLFNSFSLIFEQQFNDVYLILLKQKEEKLIEYIQGTNLNRKELLSCLRDTYKKTSTDSILAVIINKLSIMSSYSIIQDVAKERYISQIRFIFTIDEEQSTYNSPLFIKEYEEQLKKGLLLNIFKDNQWCSLVLIDSTEAKDSQNVTVPLNCSKGIQFSFIGFNPRDFNYGSQLKIDNSLGPLEFSGLLHNKEKVMGFVSWDLAQLKTELKPVDEFLWRVPDSWSLEDASTVTFSYSVAFYSLKLLMKLKPSECVLIHSGFSTLGNAAISVALQIGSTVFTTVSNEIQKQNLLSQFPKLNAERVLQLENNWFEEHILSKTSGKGANVIICTLAGDSFHASLRCLAISGRIMQLNKADIELGHKIGMSVFVKNTSLYGFDAENLFMAPIEWKKAIHLDVKEGIKKGFVKPLKKQVYPITSNKEALKNVLSSNGERKVVLSLKDENKKNTNELISSNNTNNKSCIIVGSDSGVWLDLIQSLFKNGISSFVVALNNNHYISASSSRKLKELASQHGISIQTLSIKQLDSVQHAENILLNTLKYSIIEFIIVVLMESGSDSVQNLDLVSRKLIPDVKFIYLMGSGEKLCESRVNNGFHATMITNSSENIDPSLLTSLCESICLHSWKHKFCVVSQLSTDKDDGNDYSKKLLENYLPSGLSELKMIDYSKNTYSFSEIRSLSPRMGDLPSSTPIFILPGLSLTFINSLTLQLMVPVFCAEIPQKILSAKEAAESLIGPLLEIQSNGPYNIIGETWSGSIALELARLLEYAGHTVLVILLTATPHTFQYLTKTLGSYDCVNFKNTIFSTIFQLQSNLWTYGSFNWTYGIEWSDNIGLQYSMFDEITGFHDEDVTWDDCVTKLLSKEKFGTISKDEEKLHNSLNFIHNRILCTLNYEMHPLKKGNIVIIHPDNCLTLDCDLNKLYGDNVTLHIMEESNHKVMLSSIKTADLINELIHFIY